MWPWGSFLPTGLAGSNNSCLQACISLYAERPTLLNFHVPWSTALIDGTDCQTANDAKVNYPHASVETAHGKVHETLITTSSHWR